MQEASRPKFDLLTEVEHATLWVEERPVALAAMFSIVAVWLGVDFCVTSHVGISPFSSSWLAALPALIATASVVIALITGFMLIPAVALRVPLGPGRPSLIDTEEINRPLGKTSGTVTSLERRWVVVVLVQFVAVPGVSILAGRFLTMSFWSEAGLAFGLLAIDVWLPMRALLFRLFHRPSFNFWLFAGGAITLQAVMAIFVTNRFAGVIYSSPKDAGRHVFEFMLLLSCIGAVQLWSAYSARRSALRGGAMSRALIYSLTVLLGVAIFPPFGGVVLAIPMHTVGMEGRKCIIYSINKEASEKVHPELLGSGKSTTQPVISATPSLDGIHFLHLRDDKSARVFRLRDEFITATDDCPEKPKN